jgi:hypothetical protein
MSDPLRVGKIWIAGIIDARRHIRVDTTPDDGSQMDQGSSAGMVMEQAESSGKD